MTGGFQVGAFQPAYQQFADAQTGVGSSGGGGGRIAYVGRMRGRAKLDKDINRLLDEALAETLYRDVVKAGEAEAVAPVVRPHTDSKRAAVPSPETVDWDAVTRDVKAVSALLQTWRRIEREREIAEDDDETWLLM